VATCAWSIANSSYAMILEKEHQKSIPLLSSSLHRVNRPNTTMPQVPQAPVSHHTPENIVQGKEQKKEMFILPAAETCPSGCPVFSPLNTRANSSFPISEDFLLCKSKCGSIRAALVVPQLPCLGKLGLGEKSWRVFILDYEGVWEEHLVKSRIPNGRRGRDGVENGKSIFVKSRIPDGWMPW